jgi:uncharacterized membrane protein YedE/YeeE
VKAGLAALVSGLVFALGLGLGGMTDPAKVQGFLDVTGAWDPSLAFVMAGGLGTHALLRRLLLRRRSSPVLAPAFPAAPQSGVDRRLLIGSALFGLGWGLAGYCPGPAVVAVASGSTTALTFALSMVGGMVLFQGLESLRKGAARASSAAGEAGAPAES